MKILPTLALAAWALAAAPAWAVDACANTTNAAANACANEARDDYWIGVGNCYNLGSTGARQSCLAETKAGLSEAQEECDEQFAARQDLCAALGPEPYDPDIDPARFLTPAQAAANPNRYFPLVPGRTWVYQGPDERITVRVTDQTHEIMGVTVTEVRDTAQEDGQVVEDTRDWFAQDVDGNVWYFGELSLNFEDGQLVDMDGSWTAGVDGAKPGIIMRAAPVAHEFYRQEFALGEAEDAAEVLGTAGSATTPAASCSGTCVVTHDFTPLEPDANERKFYAPDVGLILEVNRNTGERTRLVSYQP